MGIRELLQEPLEGLNNCNVQDTFAKIARNLFNNCYIECGDIEYYFAEIEFYYYDKEQCLGSICEQYKWQLITYARSDKKVGDFLYHLSGIDICFDSRIDSDFVRFGGILIRSIKDKNGKVVAAGPYTCRDFILNECSKKTMSLPKLAVREKLSDITPIAIYRYISTYDLQIDKDLKLKLCFYDGNLDWVKTSEKDVYDKKKGTIVPNQTRNYSSRFRQ
ncbi:MAG: hypothetical protein K6G92_09305 [Bacteroidaceae bacterium]|nr:hypothetical protein [Bacteroidaceae bacterium]